MDLIDVETILDAMDRLGRWVRAAGWRGYDPFDALAGRALRLASLGLAPGRIAAIQLLKRLPWNVRPWLGVPPHESPFALALSVRGCLDAWRATGEAAWRASAIALVDRLHRAQTPGYAGACWGYPFAYQNRIFHTPPRTPTAVITSFAGAAMLDAHAALGRPEDWRAAEGACEFIMTDLRRTRDGPGRFCFSYTPLRADCVHNASALAGALLVRVGRAGRRATLIDAGRRALAYTVAHQRPDGWWPYGEGLRRLAWVDNHHTAYVLESLWHAASEEGDAAVRPAIEKGLRFYLSRFFGADGTPYFGPAGRGPVDIQCAAAAIDVLALLGVQTPECLDQARRVAAWTVRHMQDRDGHFWYRRGRLFVNRTPFVHWGQATMLAALARLARVLRHPREATESWDMTRTTASPGITAGITA